MAEKIVNINQKKESKKVKFDGKKILSDTKGIFIGAFHTLVCLGFGYIIIIMFTILIPSTVAYILGSLGFSNDNATGAMFIVSLMAALFLTAWIFVLSFMFLRFIWKIYKRNMKKCLPKSIVDKIQNVYKKGEI